jgi:hypothetical protein
MTLPRLRDRREAGARHRPTSWNRQGVAGRAGAQGVQGPAGGGAPLPATVTPDTQWKMTVTAPAPTGTFSFALKSFSQTATASPPLGGGGTPVLDWQSHILKLRDG